MSTNPAMSEGPSKLHPSIVDKVDKRNNKLINA